MYNKKYWSSSIANISRTGADWTLPPPSAPSNPVRLQSCRPLIWNTVGCTIEKSHNANYLRLYNIAGIHGAQGNESAVFRWRFRSLKIVLSARDAEFRLTSFISPKNRVDKERARVLERLQTDARSRKPEALLTPTMKRKRSSATPPRDFSIYVDDSSRGFHCSPFFFRNPSNGVSTAIIS